MRDRSDLLQGRVVVVVDDREDAEQAREDHLHGLHEVLREGRGCGGREQSKQSRISMPMQDTEREREKRQCTSTVERLNNAWNVGSLNSEE